MKSYKEHPAKRASVVFILILLLSACNPGKSNSPEPSHPTVISVTDGVPAPTPINLAFSKPVTVSSALVQGPPKNAVDGVPFTKWEAGANAHQWIQIDLENYATVTGIRMTIAQTLDGDSVHQVLAGASLLDQRLIHEFSGATKDNQVLEFILDTPLIETRYIKILTTKSPDPVSWKEIEVLGYFGDEIPTPAPQKEMADVIYTNGQILTMEKDQPTAQAIALKGQRILAMGSESEVMAYKNDSTNIVDLNGLTLTPGFIDSHVHRIGDRNLYGNNTAIQDIFDKTLRQGWTSIHEMFVHPQRLTELQSLADQKLLPVRVSAYLAVGYGYDYNPWYKNTAYKPLQNFGLFLQIAGIKITLDQEWGEKIFFDQNQLNGMVLDATSDGWQVATHSFSPAANEEVLNAYEKVLNGGSNDQLRLRLEHTGVMTDAEVQKMGQLGIIGSVQLIGASMWMEDVSFKKYIPASETQHSARWRDLLNAGVFLIGNTDDPWCCTDWRNGLNQPAVEASVIQAIYQSVTRNSYSGKQPEAWQVAQILTVQEALEMLTIHGAYAAHQENEIGSLKPGKYADMVILSGNPLTTPIEQIANIEIIMTMVGGQAKYCAAEQNDICVSSAK